MHEMLSSLLQWYLGALDQGGYLLIALLMAMESSIIPLPSEVVIPPAAYLAHSQGRFSLTGIVVAGTVGSWVGAAVMYWGSRLLGRPLLMRYGKYVAITPAKIEHAEAWSSHYGMVGVFILTGGSRGAAQRNERRSRGLQAELRVGVKAPAAGRPSPATPKVATSPRSSPTRRTRSPPR